MHAKLARIRLSFLLFLLSICFVQAQAQTDYYISNNGSDSNTGTSEASPWKTLSKIQLEWNAGTFTTGDQILLDRGSIFQAGLVLNTYEEISFGAYGTGNLPVISNADTVSGAWANLGNNIWSHAISNTDDHIYFLQINGKHHVIGRYPNNDDRDTLTDYLDRPTVYDNTSTSPNAYWDGGGIFGEVVKTGPEDS